MVERRSILACHLGYLDAAEPRRVHFKLSDDLEYQRYRIPNLVEAVQTDRANREDVLTYQRSFRLGDKMAVYHQDIS